jgi:hypothetical protein
LKRIPPFIRFKQQMGKHAESVDSRVLRRIRAHGRGWVFTPSSFHDLGTRTAVALALMRHKRDGTIRKLARGLYDYPQNHPTLGLLAPPSDSIAKAIAGRYATRLQPSGAHATNLLGLSAQVPMKVVYLTDGPPRSVRIGNQQITLRPTTPRNMATAGRISGLVIQALRQLGKEAIDESTIDFLRARLSEKDKAVLEKDVRYAPAWVAEVIRKVSVDSANRSEDHGQVS